MNILLDTHAFLWFVANDPRLSNKARVLIEAEDSQPFLSVASLWEMAIKISIGKLEIDQPFGDFVAHQLTLNGIGVLSLSLEHISAIATLPFHHRDPFDRLIVFKRKLSKCLWSAPIRCLTHMRSSGSGDKKFTP